MRTHFTGMSFAALLVVLVSGLSAVVMAGETDRWDEVSKRAQARLEEFFVLVNARQTEEAMRIMDPRMLATDAQRQAWRSQLGAIRSIHVIDVVPVEVEAWAPRRQKFKVSLEAHAADTPAAPVPFHGWHDNPNTRWITMVLGEKKAWQIREIATGP